MFLMERLRQLKITKGGETSLQGWNDQVQLEALFLMFLPDREKVNAIAKTWKLKPGCSFLASVHPS